MKQILTALTISFIFGNSSFSQGTWSSLGNITGVSRHAAVGFTIGDFGYMCTGVNGSSNLLTDMWQYDPSTDSWTQKATFPGAARCGAAGFSIGNYGYIGTGGGASGVFFNDFWRYDAVNNVWKQRADFPGQKRFGAIGFSISDFGYMGIGWSSPSYYHDLWQYDPVTDTWNKKTDYPGNGSVECSAISLGSKGYVGLGANPCNNTFIDFWEYDPLSDTWLKEPDYPGNAKQNPVRFAICNKIYIGWGDRCGPPYLTDFYQFDPAIKSWLQQAAFPGIGRDNPFMFSIGDKGYAGTGLNGTTLVDFWEFTPDSNNICFIPPVCNFQSSDTAICANDCISFTNLSTNATSWQWTFPGGMPSSGTEENPQVCYLAAGIFNVTLIAFNSGGSDTLNINNYITVNAVPPAPVIEPMNDTLLIFTANPAYISYQWYLDSTIIPNATDTFLVISKSGNYNVEVTGTNGCKIAVGINVVLGLQNWMKDHLISLWPNPVRNNLQFAIGNWQNEKVNLQINIYNVLGELVQRISPLLPNGAGRDRRTPDSCGEADVSTLPPGVYFVQIIGEKERWVGRFVKG